MSMKMKTRIHFALFSLVFVLSGCMGTEANDDSDSESLIPTCQAGGHGCACAAGDLCFEGLECAQGVCQLASCEQGQKGCVCDSDLSCGEGLICDEREICVDSTGREGGPCFSNGLCAQNLKCAESDVCEYCEPGSLGCSCLSNGTCHTGMGCELGRCISNNDLKAPPKDPKCYTLCRDSFTDSEGVYRACSSDGLIEGCLPGQTCREGSCLKPEKSMPTCGSDAECPSHQVCIRNQCYSDCSRNEDCGGQVKCYQHACRLPCTSKEGGCPGNYHCMMVDSDQGYCMPTAIEEEAPVIEQVQTSFEISKSYLNYSNIHLGNTVVITNKSPLRHEFVIEKVSENRFDGRGKVTRSPLPRLALGTEESEELSRVSSYRFQVPGEGGEVTLRLVLQTEDAEVPERWEGELRIGLYVPEEDEGGAAPQMTEQTRVSFQPLIVSYSEKPEGRWAGRMYYFSQFKDDQLEDWFENKNDGVVENAFLRKWSTFRAGGMPKDEFDAILTATKTESWKWPSVQEDCGVNRGACYMYVSSNGDAGAFDEGVHAYTNDFEQVPIPSGVVEFPIVMDLEVAGVRIQEEEDLPDEAMLPDEEMLPDEAMLPGEEMDSREDVPEAGAQITELRGRIVSSESLQYAGDPEVHVQIAGDLNTCTQQNSSACIHMLSGFSSTVVVGGRFPIKPSEREGGSECGLDGTPYADFELYQKPWLIPGFLGNAELDEESGAFYEYECRDGVQPYSDDPELVAQNLSFAGSNPVPDGRSRVRHLEFLDGVVINQNELFIIFRERFESFYPNSDDDFIAYGFMELGKINVDLDAEDFIGNPQSEPREEAFQDQTRLASCDEEILQKIPGYQRNPNDALLGTLDVVTALSVLLDGVPADMEGPPQTYLPEEVHYLCHETGLFDGGMRPEDDLDAAFARERCPEGSHVTYFVLQDARGDIIEAYEDLSELDCQEDGSCNAMLENWRSDQSIEVVENPIYRCIDDVGGAPLRHCDENRHDLREGKAFYKPAEGGAEQPVFLPLYTAIDNAFRYKSRFQSRQGGSLGFTPERCAKGSNARPYCYDPELIEETQARIDCMLAVYTHPRYTADLASTHQTRQVRGGVKRFLEINFAYEGAINDFNEVSIEQEGFEKLYAELLIMLGDEAYTSAFRSRFDLAGSNIASFEGSKFEPGGIDIAGVAGSEMQNLYKAAQYYQLVLDRFYALSHFIFGAMDAEDVNQSFIRPSAAVSYFDKLMRASTQHSRTWSEIAKRYQNLNRPDLARLVIERAYTSAYIESIVFSKLMLALLEEHSGSRYRDQLRLVIDRSSKTYQAALLDMQEVYANITDEINYFGFSPDYIPLPALDPSGPNAFETLLGTANQSVDVAAEKEQRAIADHRSYETDSESFQAELVQIRNTYENQLLDICGTFEGTDGNVYPAIKKYAYLHDTLKHVGDPCGFVGNGQIHQKMGEVELSSLNIKSKHQAFERIKKEVEIEMQRATSQCGREFSARDFYYEIQGEENSLEQDIQEAEKGIQRTMRRLDFAINTAEIAGCALMLTLSGGTACGAQALIDGAKQAARDTAEWALEKDEDRIYRKQNQINDLKQDRIVFEAENQCDALKIDSNAIIAEKVLAIRGIEIEAHSAEKAMRLALSEIEQLRNKAKRLYAEQEETEELTINIEAAQNDPNVRIYKNDAVLNADKTFYAALRNVYRATKVFEYYTSQSYAALNELSLVRMVAAGDYNLENYLFDLEEAYYQFLETAGRPDLRVEILSLKNDVLGIPYVDEQGELLTQKERTSRFITSISDTSYLDGRGYMRIPFSTSLARISPLTRNHKISHIEIELIGADIGDEVGRMYITQAGTGLVHSLDDRKSYYRFPERTAVVNPFFNGVRSFSPEIYRNNRLRDRPYVNSHWELVFNQRDEHVNQDINLSSLNDVRVYIYYTDFTEL